MSSDIKGIEEWEGKSRSWNKKAGALKTRAGVGLLNALENWYAAWKKKPTDRSRREYMLWRLRLHLKHNTDPTFLEELNETFEIGLYDEEVGPLYWNLAPEHSSGMRTGYNWRRDSGWALQGGRKNKTYTTDQMEAMERDEFTNDPN